VFLLPDRPVIARTSLMEHRNFLHNKDLDRRDKDSLARRVGNLARRRVLPRKASNLVRRVHNSAQTTKKRTRRNSKAAHKASSSVRSKVLLPNADLHRVLKAKGSSIPKVNSE
jgi:hypothetical protein